MTIEKSGEERNKEGKASGEGDGVMAEEGVAAAKRMIMSPLASTSRGGESIQLYRRQLRNRLKLAKKWRRLVCRENSGSKGIVMTAWRRSVT